MTSSYSSTNDTIYTHLISSLLHNFDYHQSKQVSWRIFSTLSRQYVEIEGFFSIFNDCFCSTIIEDGKKSFYLLSNSLFTLLVSLFRSWMMLLEQVASLIVWTKKLLFLNSLLNSLLGGDFLLTQHRETLLVKIQKYSVKVFSAIHVRISRHGLTTLPVGRNPFVFSTRTEFLCKRARVVSLLNHFLFHPFIFIFRKTNKILITISFSLCPGSSSTFVD